MRKRFDAVMARIKTKRELSGGMTVDSVMACVNGWAGFPILKKGQPVNYEAVTMGTVEALEREERNWNPGGAT